MGILSIFLLVLFVITCLLLILMVLMQDEQGDGIGGIFGGGGSQFGSRSGNILTKFTSVLAAVFLITSFGLAWVNKTTDKGDILGAAYRQDAETTEVTEWWDSSSEEEKTE